MNKSRRDNDPQLDRKTKRSLLLAKSLCLSALSFVSTQRTQKASDAEKRVSSPGGLGCRGHDARRWGPLWKLGRVHICTALPVAPCVVPSPKTFCKLACVCKKLVSKMRRTEMRRCEGQRCEGQRCEGQRCEGQRCEGQIEERERERGSKEIRCIRHGMAVGDICADQFAVA